MSVTTRRVVREIPRAAIIQMELPQLERDVVAAYARVSTEKEEQEDSFERQVSHYTALITSKPEWKFGGIYADPGITGTRAEKRPDFMRMINDCRAGKINKVLPAMRDYFETENYVFTHAWIPCIRERNGSYSYYST